jgi:hypothetical protein
MTSEATYETGFPVNGFPMQYRWQAGIWYDLFERQIALLENERRRAIGKYGISDQITGYFEGRQIAPGTSVVSTAPGYEVVE